MKAAKSSKATGAMKSIKIMKKPCGKKLEVKPAVTSVPKSATMTQGTTTALAESSRPVASEVGAAVKLELAAPAESSTQVVAEVGEAVKPELAEDEEVVLASLAQPQRRRQQRSRMMRMQSRKPSRKARRCTRRCPSGP